MGFAAHERNQMATKRAESSRYGLGLEGQETATQVRVANQDGYDQKRAAPEGHSRADKQNKEGEGFAYSKVS